MPGPAITHDEGPPSASISEKCAPILKELYRDGRHSRARKPENWVRKMELIGAPKRHPMVASEIACRIDFDGRLTSHVFDCDEKSSHILGP